jgi:hypothetical protein
VLTQSLPLLARSSEIGRMREGDDLPARLAARDRVLDYLHAEHITQNVPTHEQETPEEAAERDRLAALFGQGKPVSDIIVEERD